MHFHLLNIPFIGWYSHSVGTLKTTRDLYKTYGIWFQINVTSEIGRFDLFNSIKVIFVGLAMVKICDIIFNFLVDNIFPKIGCFPVLQSEEYAKARYLVLDETTQQTVMSDEASWYLSLGESQQENRDFEMKQRYNSFLK